MHHVILFDFVCVVVVVVGGGIHSVLKISICIEIDYLCPYGIIQFNIKLCRNVIRFAHSRINRTNIRAERPENRESEREKKTRTKRKMPVFSTSHMHYMCVCVRFEAFCFSFGCYRRWNGFFKKKKRSRLYTEYIAYMRAFVWVNNWRCT